MDHELEQLEQYIERTRARLDNRRRLRESNQADHIESSRETTIDKLVSSVKHSTAFVKKLKSFSSGQKEQIISEIERFNLTNFISEVSWSIFTAKLKLDDIPALIEVCSRLHSIYKEFCVQLFDRYSKYFPTVSLRKRLTESPVVSHLNSSSNATNISETSSPSQPSRANLMLKSQGYLEDEKNLPSQSRTKIDLRLYTELIVAGIFPLKDGLSLLNGYLCYLMFYDKSYYKNSGAILNMCLECGDEIMGLIPAEISDLAMSYDREIPKSNLVPPKYQEIIKNSITIYYRSLIRRYHHNNEELNQLSSLCVRLYKSRGEITDELRSKIESMRLDHQRDITTLNQLGAILGESSYLPDLEAPKSQGEVAVDAETSVESNTDPSSMISLNCIWDDESSRSFYEDLIDLRETFPNLIRKINIKDKLELPLSDKIANVSADSTDTNCSPTPITNDKEEKNLSSASSEESLVAGTSNQEDSSVNQSPNVSSSSRMQPEQYFSKLSHCVNRDMIDEAAVNFMRYFNTKYGRRKLIKTLFNVQRTRLDLLPFFARLTATIHPYVPNIATELAAMLKRDFRDLFRKKDQINIESKVKNVRFIGELVKFNLFAKHEAINCLKMLLSDFTHHHIEMTCNLLETCGRLLFKSPDYHHQTRLLLEQMMRKKLLLSVDSKYITMIENAYFFSNPPEVTRQVIEEPPVHLYVRYLLCECLNRSTIEKVLQKIKKLDWTDKDLTKFVISCMTEAYNVKFYNIRYLAALLAAINREHQWMSIAVIDGVVEDILLMLEINDFHFNQRRIPMIRYFGELYNYKLSDSSLVFKILYSLITYDVVYPEPPVRSIAEICSSELDMPDNLFRIKLVCDLLDTCGQYLSNSGTERKKLDCYLLFFQRYYWLKKHVYLIHPYCITKSGDQFPASIEYMFNDAIHNLRPSFQLATSYSQAVESLREFIDAL